MKSWQIALEERRRNSIVSDEVNNGVGKMRV
jgi:hypothetical protein